MNKITKSILNTFSELVKIPSPAGFEQKTVEFLQDKLLDLGYEPQTDKAGNIWVSIDGVNNENPLTILAAHIDEIGMIVEKIHPDGTLKIINHGGLKPHKIGERPIEIIGDMESITAMISMGSGHAPSVNAKPISWNDVTVHTGFSVDELAQFGIRPGSAAVPIINERGPVLFGNSDDPLLASWTFDDRMGVAVLLELLKTMKVEQIIPESPMVIAFTSKEEIGGFGARSLAKQLSAQTFIAIDGCPILPDSPLCLDGTPGIWTRDRITVYDQELIRFIIKCAAAAGTGIRPALFDSAASDASMVLSTGGVERIATFGHVRENSHGYEFARLSVFENVLKILIEFVKKYDM